MRIRFLAGILLILGFSVFQTFSQHTKPPPGKWWVFFTDKGPQHEISLSFELPGLTEKAKKRRIKMDPKGVAVHYTDLPLYAAHVEAVRQSGANILQHSRWLNAVSVEASHDVISTIEANPIVDKTVPVSRFHRSEPEARLGPPLSFSKTFGDFDYGDSFDQVNLIRIPRVHSELNLDGDGVTIAVFDAGFNNLEHACFAQLDVIDTWDFVNNDSNVDDEGDLGSGNHGTYVLSCLAGFAEGDLIGPAFGASFLLAKTENTESELHTEEDNWIAALEWAEMRGADLVTSSVGYSDGFTSGNDYVQSQLDGNTIPITIAADIAVSEKGMVVVNSAGNEGNTTWQKVIAPADGDFVIAAGAVDFAGLRAGFSSRGPTADGRIKPDVMAPGVAIHVASALNPGTYISQQGTSFSAPLTAGVSALILQAHPDWTPFDVIDALRKTASTAASPDTLYGWGVIDAFEAIRFKPRGKAGTIDSLANYPNPFSLTTTLAFTPRSSGTARLQFFNTLGQKVDQASLPVTLNQPATFRWNATNRHGGYISSGLYVCRISLNGSAAHEKLMLIR